MGRDEAAPCFEGIKALDCGRVPVGVSLYEIPIETSKGPAGKTSSPW